MSATQPLSVSSIAGAGAGAAAYGYDGAGNTTSVTPTGQAATTYPWDPNGHLATTSGPGGATSNVYDGDGSLLVARDGTGKTLYADPATEIRYTAASNSLKVSQEYAWLGRPVAQGILGGTLTYLVDDPHHTGLVAEDSSENVVAVRRCDPYGVTRGATTGSWPNGHGFLGQPTNTTTGLSHLGAREYNPATGSFLSVDPQLDLNDPTQWNAYGYADHNPVTLTDPTGTRPACLDEGTCTVATGSHQASHASTHRSSGYVRYRANRHGWSAGNSQFYFRPRSFTYVGGPTVRFTLASFHSEHGGSETGGGVGGASAAAQEAGQWGEGGMDPIAAERIALEEEAMASSAAHLRADERAAESTATVTGTRPAHGRGLSLEYQRTYAGPTEIEITGRGESIWADGVEDSTLVEAKYVGSSRSPYIPGSGVPEVVQESVDAQQANEMFRYATVISSGGAFTQLRIVTNSPAAVPYFEGIMSQYGVPGQVVVRPGP